MMTARSTSLRAYGRRSSNSSGAEASSMTWSSGGTEFFAQFFFFASSFNENRAYSKGSLSMIPPSAVVNQNGTSLRIGQPGWTDGLIAIKRVEGQSSPLIIVERRVDEARCQSNRKGGRGESADRVILPLSIRIVNQLGNVDRPRLVIF